MPINLKFGTKLVPRKLEDELKRGRLFSRELSSEAGSKLPWSTAVREQGLFFDLSQVEWVELGALAQAVTLVEAAAREEIEITLALPLARARRSEQEFLVRGLLPRSGEEITRRVNARINARSFLEHVQFRQALLDSHITRDGEAVRVLSDYDNSEEDNTNRSNVPMSMPVLDERTGREILFRYAFPLRWISGCDVQELQTLALFLTRTISSRERGIRKLDADALANVILFELVDNVRLHAVKTTHALVAAWARPPQTPPESAHYLDSEQAFVDWIRQAKQPIIEIIVADSGIGIAGTLGAAFHAARAQGIALPGVVPREEGNVLLWAFNRWSTSSGSIEKRGTRGLYRVDRVVRKYQGLLTVRSGRELVGLDHGGASHDENVFESSKLAFYPGTLLRARVPMFREVSLTRGEERPGRPLRLEFLILELGRLTAPALSEANRKRLLEVFLNGLDLCVVITLRGDLVDPKAVESLIRELIEIRHPAALVAIGQLGGTELLENAVASVNAELEKTRKWREQEGLQGYEIWDPVLVIPEPGLHLWAGVTEDYSKLLSALYSSGSGLLSVEVLRQVIDSSESASGADRAEVLRAIRNDPNLLRCHDNGDIELRITVAGITATVADILTKYIQAFDSWGSPEKAIGPENQVRPRTMQDVTFRLDVESMLSTLNISRELLSLILADMFRSSEVGLKNVSLNSVIVALSVPLDRAKSIAGYLGCEEFEMFPLVRTQGKMAPLKVVRLNSRVLIHCDILESDEALLGCLGQVLAAEGIPVAITCIVDGRGCARAMEVRGGIVPVLSLVQMPMVAEVASAGAELPVLSSVARPVEGLSRFPPMGAESLDGKDSPGTAAARRTPHFTRRRRGRNSHDTDSAGVGKAFESKVANLYRLLGAEVIQNVEVCHKKVDLVATFKVPGSSSAHRVIVECKGEKVGRAQNQRVMEFAGLLDLARRCGEADSAEIITEAGWGDQAKGFARSRQIDLLTYEQKIAQLIDFGQYLREMVREFEAGLPERPSEPPLASYYVPPSVIVDSRSGETSTEAYAFLSNWLKDNDGRQLAILGGYGTGKTSLSRKLAHDLGSAYLANPGNSRIPLLLNLRSFTKALSLEALVTAFLDSVCGVQNPRLQLFKAMNEAGILFLIFDGFDEMAVKVDADTLEVNLREIEKLAGPTNARVLLTSRTEYFVSAAEQARLLQPRGQILATRDVEYLVARIQPWDAVNVDLFLERRVPLIANAKNNWRFYRDQINKISGLADLARRPVLLEMIVKTLPQLIDSDKPINVSSLYEAYLIGELKRQKVLKERNLLLGDSDRLAVLQDLAVEFYAVEKWAISFGEAQAHVERRVRPPRSELEAHTRDFLNCSFLIRERDGFRFSHRSIMEYLVARALFQEICERSPQYFGRVLLDRVVGEFVHEMQPEKETLWEWVRGSRSAKTLGLEYLGGNAVTLLCMRAGSILRDRELIDAYLNGARFGSVDLTRTQFAGARLDHVNLVTSRFEEEALGVADIGVADFGIWIHVPFDSEALEDRLMSLRLNESKILGWSILGRRRTETLSLVIARCAGLAALARLKRELLERVQVRALAVSSSEREALMKEFPEILVDAFGFVDEDVRAE